MRKNFMLMQEKLQDLMSNTQNFLPFILRKTLLDLKHLKVSYCCSLIVCLIVLTLFGVQGWGFKMFNRIAPLYSELI